ncbi:MAG: hypothetical protein KAI72_06295, partial [Candidatus Pacebacteria bacterium]|nr:hypothetical protein [Candidatus Paceibacterota bacterium]
FNNSTGADLTWADKDLSGYSVPANAITEFILAHGDVDAEEEMGVRANGSSLNRYITLQEAEGGGYDMTTMLVQADDSSIIEIIHGDVSITHNFYLIGYWTSAPGAYTEKFENFDNSTGADLTWADKDLSGYSVPANATAEFTLGHNLLATEEEMGIRTNGSSLVRYFKNQEAEDGGYSCSRMHVQADASSIIEIIHGDVSDPHNFYLTGYWEKFITISGTSNGTGTVKWAKNGVAQGESATISASSWTISGLATPPTAGDIITVWIDNVAEGAESTAVTEYDGADIIEGMTLNANVLSIGSDDTGVSIALSDLGYYDCLDDEDIMHNATTVSTTLEVAGVG